MGDLEFEKPPEVVSEIINEVPYISTIVYPNPNRGKFTIELLGVKPNSASLSIKNQSGQTIHTRSLNINENTLKLLIELDIQLGIYFIEIKNNTGQVIMIEKIVIE
jgi:hypothetical protein